MFNAGTETETLAHLFPYALVSSVLSRFLPVKITLPWLAQCCPICGMVFRTAYEQFLTRCEGDARWSICKKIEGDIKRGPAGPLRLCSQSLFAPDFGVGFAVAILRVELVAIA
jgi:hypothetical protein